MVINTHDANQEQFDHDILIVDKLGARFGSTLEWAAQVRDAMPNWGFEIHCIRWLAGVV
jgi:hypothetical protein